MLLHWNRNVPRASHQNGVVKSLIISVRRALEVSSKTQVLTEEQRRTFNAHFTSPVNQRPRYPSSNGSWEGQPVTPNELLIGNHFPPPVAEEQSKVNPRDLVRSTEKRVQEFWYCWLNYFAPDLLPQQMVPKEVEPERERSCFGDGTYPQTRTWQLAVLYRNISWRRRTREERKDKNGKCSLRQTHSQIMPNCYQ